VNIISLVPSATETLVALGVTPIACTRFCDLPGVRTVGGTKNPDIDAIVALAPDLVVVTDEENRVEDARALESAGLALHSMSPRSLGDVGPAVRALAAAIGVRTPAPFDDWDTWLDSTRQNLTQRAFIAIWRRPWMSLAGDTYGSSLLQHLGTANVFADATERYPEVALAEVARRAPDVVLLPSEPYVFNEHHADEVRTALRGVAIEFVDGRDLFWWGVRTPKAVARFSTI
jgi:ABC-type Fe3+-hydroxamate transport system substrate-binding protein